MIQKETLFDRVVNAPTFSPAMGLELGELASRYICITAMLGKMLEEAGREVAELPNADFSTEQGRFQAAQRQGAIAGIRACVGLLIEMMEPGTDGDSSLSAPLSRPAKLTRPKRPSRKSPTKAKRRK